MKKEMMRIALCVLMVFCTWTVYGQNSDAERGIRLYQQKSYTAALPLMQRAAKAGNIEVLPYLGTMFLEGLGTSKNTTAALNMYKRGAEHGNATCMYAISLMYAKGQGVAKDQAQAFAYAKKAADMNSPSACIAVSTYYATGDGTAKDIPQAVVYAEKGFNLGNKSLCGWLGAIYASGEGGISKDYTKALKYWTQTGAKYSPEIRLLTAQFLHDGIGTSSTIESYPCTYPQKIHGNGVDGKTYLAEALTIVDELVKQGYDKARTYQRDWKYEYDEKITAANKVVAPQFTDEIRRYVASYNVPREIAYAGGRAQYQCVIRSNGKVGNVQTLVSSVAAKTSFDQTFLSNLPRFIPGTKGGQPIDMVVVFWLDWVPSRNLQMAQCSPAY